ncbi:MAG: hypothetical protein WCJ11_12470 [Methylococcaceae bacterium]
MANRPVYVPFPTGKSFVVTYATEFEWFAGMSKSQKQKSIDSLHKVALTRKNITNPLEISSKSLNPLGVQLSAFNLMIENKDKRISFSVENAFQAGKVFANGGPYLDLLHTTSREAKSDLRLKNSGRLIKFVSNGNDWPLEPMTVFYDWIYINALCRQKHLAEQLLSFDAFTDIEFNPLKSINCQAYSAALYVSLVNRNLLEEALSTPDSFIKMMSESQINNAYKNQKTDAVNNSIF